LRGKHGSKEGYENVPRIEKEKRQRRRRERQSRRI
jgi:hypothetical protein